MVFKAFIKDGKTYFLCGELGSRRYIDHFDKGTLPDTTYLRINVCNGEYNIPDAYLGEFDLSMCKQVEITDCGVLLKELCPDTVLKREVLVGDVFKDHNWVMIADKGVCTIDGIRSKDGYWCLDNKLCRYNSIREIKVLREGSTRHKKDVEYDCISINLQTGLSRLKQRYFDGCMRNREYTFDRKHRVWILVSNINEKEIIGVKR